jgi:hypothetical protein
MTKLRVASRNDAKGPQNDTGNVKLQVHTDVIRNTTAYPLLHIPFKYTNKS